MKKDLIKQKGKGQKIAENNKKIPAGVSFIAIFNFVISAFFIIAGMLFLSVGIIILSNPDVFNQQLVKEFSSNSQNTLTQEQISEILSFPWGSVALILGIIFIVLFVLLLISGVFMLKLRNWARTLEIVLFGALAVLVILGMISNPLTISFFNMFIIAIGLAISLYLLLSKEVKEAFN